MRSILSVVVIAALCGCTVPTLNSKSENHSCSEMTKCCGCEGMTHCRKDADGNLCCKPDDCSCMQSISRR